jgi:hypothetical protein
MHPGDHRISQTGEGEIVPATTIDALVAHNVGRRVSFIKIDVQGAEMLVLQGAIETIRRQAPTLFVEVDEGALEDFESSSRAIVGLFMAEGYSMFLLDKKGIEHSISEVELRNEVTAKTKGYIDVLFRKELA